MATKKGSKEWKLNLSKQQKKSWRRRKAQAKLAGIVEAKARDKSFEYEEVKLMPPPPGAQLTMPNTGSNNTAIGTNSLHENTTGSYSGPFGKAAANVFNSEFDTKSNPKTLMGNQKVPILSVVPPTSIIAQAAAMRYGAFLAPKADGTKGYGPYNWRDQPIEAHIYIDAAMRHLMQWFDGDETELIRDDQGRVIDTINHLSFALASIGILVDAIANRTVIDTRPRVRKMTASSALHNHKLTRY